MQPMTRTMFMLALAPAVLTGPSVLSSEANDGLQLPKGFKATVFHEGVGRARYVAVRDNGDVYVSTKPPQGATTGALGTAIVALRDTNKDGTADVVENFGGIE